MALNIPSGQNNDSSTVLFVDFNQDFTSLVVGTQYGYSIYSTASDKIEEIFSKSGEKTCMIGRLFASSLVTLVNLNDMRKLLVFHFRRNTLICHYRYSHNILAVKMNRQRLIVCVEDGIFIHNIRDMEMLHKVEETPPNRNGIVALSSSSDNCYLAYPGSHRVGTVVVFDALHFQNVTSIAAHDGLLAALAFNHHGDLLATASEKGTVIRVFAVPSGAKVAEFRRGLARCAVISSLSFSLDSQYLVAASNTETVHVFKMDWKNKGDVAGSEMPPGHEVAPVRSRNISDVSDTHDILADEPGSAGAAEGGTGGWLIDWMGSALKASASYLPSQVSQVLTQDRAFAWAKLPQAGLKKVAAIVYINRQPQLLVASQDGLLYMFAVDPKDGGESPIAKTVNLIGASDSQSDGGPGLVETVEDEAATLDPAGGKPCRNSSYADLLRGQEGLLQAAQNQSEPTGLDSLNAPVGSLRIHDDEEFPPVSLTPGKSH